jgi:opacity protein-like surface antigen
MFNKSILSAIIFAFSASIGFAQTSEDRHGWEVFGGYSNNQVDVGSTNNSNFRDTFASREHLGGVEASAVKNISRFIGIKADFSAHVREVQFAVPRTIGENEIETLKLNASLYNFLGGVQFKDNRKDGGRVRPFGHALVGAAYGRTSVKSYSTGFCHAQGVSCTGLDGDDTGFAAAIGGGVDVKLNNRFTVRAGQADYNPTRLNGTTQHNFRFSIGVVFH